MKLRLLFTISSLTLTASLATPVQVFAQATIAPQLRYTVSDLGPTNDTAFSQATFVANDSFITGLTLDPDLTQHAVLWHKDRITDLGTPGLGGQNSGAFGVNAKGEVDGQAESSKLDPNNENFCSYGTGLECLPFLWYGGTMTALPLLGGNNGTVGMINNQGEVAGIAETNIRDPQCPNQIAVNGTGPQVLDFEAVVWGPRRGQKRLLTPLPGDSVGMALGINNKGQVVGASGSCANTVLPGFAAAPHAVLWERDGSVHDLGNLGGTVNTSLLAVGNVAEAINNHGHIVGVSALPDGQSIHAFLWTNETGMQDLGTLPGDVYSAGLGINDQGDVVGASIDGNPANGNPRAYLWRNGVMTDLNTVVQADTPLYLLTAFTINDAGDIAGFGVNTLGEIHAFLATPRRKEDDSNAAKFDEKRGTDELRRVLSNTSRNHLENLLRFRSPADRELAPQ